MIEYRHTQDGERRRVHREYVEVICRCGRDGFMEPVTVIWRDGRTFHVDEVTGYIPFGPMARGRQSARYDVRFGSHETRIFLERDAADPARGKEETLRWWVEAFDVTKQRAQAC